MSGFVLNVAQVVFFFPKIDDIFFTEKQLPWISGEACLGLGVVANG